MGNWVGFRRGLGSDFGREGGRMYDSPSKERWSASSERPGSSRAGPARAGIWGRTVIWATEMFNNIIEVACQLDKHFAATHIRKQQESMKTMRECWKT